MKTFLIAITAIISGIFAAFEFGRKKNADENKIEAEKEIIKIDNKEKEIKNEIDSTSLDDLVRHNNDKFNGKQ